MKVSSLIFGLTDLYLAEPPEAISQVVECGLDGVPSALDGGLPHLRLDVSITTDFSAAVLARDNGSVGADLIFGFESAAAFGATGSDGDVTVGHGFVLH